MLFKADHTRATTNRRSLNRCALIAALILWIDPALSAEPDTTLKTVSYRVPPSYSTPRGLDGKWKTAMQVFEQGGVEFPKGSVCFTDPKTSLFVFHTSPQAHAEIAESLSPRHPTPHLQRPEIIAQIEFYRFKKNAMPTLPITEEKLRNSSGEHDGETYRITYPGFDDGNFIEYAHISVGCYEPFFSDAIQLRVAYSPVVPLDSNSNKWVNFPGNPSCTDLSLARSGEMTGRPYFYVTPTVVPAEPMVIEVSQTHSKEENWFLLITAYYETAVPVPARPQRSVNRITPAKKK